MINEDANENDNKFDDDDDRKIVKINDNNDIHMYISTGSETIKKYTISEIINYATISELSSNKRLKYGLYDDNGNYLMSKQEFLGFNVQTILKNLGQVNELVGSEYSLTKEEFLKNRNVNISIIGDSVTVCSKDKISAYLPNAIINCEGNRQLKQALDIFNQMKNNNELGDVLVVALGTNSVTDIRTDILEEIYNSLEGKKMIILSIIIPNVSQEKSRNDALFRFANSHENCYIADWHSIMKTHSKYFTEDNVHPVGIATYAYAQIIFKTAVNILG